MCTDLHYDFNLLPEYLDVLRDKLRIAIIYGGDPQQDGAVLYQTHNPRAWKSYKAVACDIQTALTDLGFRHVSVMPDDLTLLQRLQRDGTHLAWLNTGGVQGYDSICHAPAMLEMLGIPYIGHAPLSAATLDNKHVFKRELQALRIPTAPFLTWNPARGTLKPEINMRFRAAFGEYAGPFVVKPVSGRASLHVHVADSLRDVGRAAAHVARQTHNSVLIERYLPGREFCVAVGGYVRHARNTFSKMTRPFAFSAIERVLEPGEAIFTSMDQRAITSDRAHPLDDGEQALGQELMCIAQSIYWDFHLRSLIRIDARADADGTLHILEANPKPDLKRPTQDVTNLIMIGLEAHDMTYHDLILGLLADRIDNLLTHDAAVVPHLVELLL